MTLERDGAAWMEAEAARYDGGDVLLTRREHSVALGDVPVPVVLVWTTAGGVFRMEGHLRQEAGECRVSPLAPADRTQRREYPRLLLSTPMRLWTSGGGCRAVLADISEAALRARLSVATASGVAGALDPGGEVRVAFTLQETDFMLHGTVLRERESDDPDSVDIIVVLDIPSRTANDLRRAIAFARAERDQDP